MTYLPTWKHNLTAWKHYMEILELEPTYVHSINQVNSQYRKLSKSNHTDTCKDCSPDDMVNLTNARNFLNQHHDKVNGCFADYLQCTIAEVFPHTAIQFDGNERLLGAVFHDFGLDSF